MNYNEAKQLADSLIDRFRPACERIEISGELRRMEKEVGEINLLALPRTKILLETAEVSGYQYIEQILTDMATGGLIAIEKAAKTAGLAELKSKGVQTSKRCWLAGWAISVQLYLVLPPATWGVRHVFGTGTDEYRHWIMKRKKYGGALPDHCRVKDGAVWNRETGEKYDTPEEIDFFRLCRLEWTAPEARVALWAK